MIRPVAALFLAGLTACAQVEVGELPPDVDTDCTWGLFCFTTTTHSDGHGVTVDFSYDGSGYGAFLMVIETEQQSMQGTYEDRIELLLDGPADRQILDLVAPAGVEFEYEWRYTIHPISESIYITNQNYRYNYPFDPSFEFPVLQGPGGDGAGAHATHVGAQEHAIDWALPLGTEVLASRDGTVVVAYAGSRVRWHGHENLVIIRHSDGTYAWYGHLLPDGALVSVGDTVRRGQPVGLSGNSGYSSEPHLHFQVSVPTPGGAYAFQTLPILFSD